MSISASYPTLRPTLLLDFANSGRLDPRVTFTRASTATYFDETGVLQSAAIDAPRFDYNPATLAARGLLIEEARTNLPTYSEQFDNAAWTKTNSSVTANVITAPDGTTTADKLTEALDVNLVHQIGQLGIAVVSLGTYTASAFVKADTRTRVRIGFLIAAGGGVVADANLTAGTIGSPSAFGGGAAVGSSIQAIGNGWYRISVSGSGAAGTSGEIRLELLDASGNRQYNGDGTSGLYIWGAQLEAGAFPTSYIPTTTTALTRSADVASVNTLSPWFNSVQGTIFAEFLRSTTPAASTFPAFVNIDDGTVNNRLALSTNSSRNLRGQVAIAGVFTTISTGNTYTEGVVSKLALGYQALNHAVVANGGTAATNTTVNVPSGLTTMRLGDQAGGFGNVNGYLRRITYYPRLLSNAELQSLTS